MFHRAGVLAKFSFAHSRGGRRPNEPVRAPRDRYSADRLAQDFAIYGLAAYYRVSGQAEALQKAIRIFELIEAHAHSDQNRGYWEACDRDWHLAEDFRLSDLEPNAIKTMNTHLHILEAYTNLCQVWDDPGLVARLRELIEVFIDHIIDPVTAHFRLFFDEDWHPQAGLVSYGHDIEGSWLLCEAAEVLGDERLISVVTELALRMAQAVYTHGLENDGSLRNESNSDGTETTYKEWWVQAEAVVGFIRVCPARFSYEWLVGLSAFYQA